MKCFLGIVGFFCFSFLGISQDLKEGGTFLPDNNQPEKETQTFNRETDTTITAFNDSLRNYVQDSLLKFLSQKSFRKGEKQFNNFDLSYRFTVMDVRDKSPIKGACVVSTVAQDSLFQIQEFENEEIVVQDSLRPGLHLFIFECDGYDVTYHQEYVTFFNQKQISKIFLHPVSKAEDSSGVAIAFSGTMLYPNIENFSRHNSFQPFMDDWTRLAYLLPGNLYYEDESYNHTITNSVSPFYASTQIDGINWGNTNHQALIGSETHGLINMFSSNVLENFSFDPVELSVNTFENLSLGRTASTKSPIQSEEKIKIQISNLYSEGFYSGKNKNKNLGYMINIRHSLLGETSNPNPFKSLKNNHINFGISKPLFADIFYKIEKKGKNMNTFSAWGLFAKSGFSPNENFKNVEINTEKAILTLNYEHQITKKIKFEPSISYLKDNIKNAYFLENISTTKTDKQLLKTQLSFHSQFTFLGSETYWIKGFFKSDYRSFDNLTFKTNDEFFNTERRITSSDLYMRGAFGFNPNKTLSISGGGGYFYQSFNNDSFFDLAASLKVNLNKKVFAKFGFSNKNKRLPYQIYFHEIHVNNNSFYDNQNLKFLKLSNVFASLNLSNNFDFYSNVSIFYRNYDNNPNSTSIINNEYPTFANAANNFYTISYSNTSTTKVWGINAAFEKRNFSGFDMKLNMAINEAKYENGGIIKEVLSKFNSGIFGNFILRKNFPLAKNIFWNNFLTLNYQRGFRYFKAENFNTASGNNFVVPENGYNGILDNFFRADLSTAIHFKVLRSLHRISANILNITNRKNSINQSIVPSGVNTTSSQGITLELKYILEI